MCTHMDSLTGKTSNARLVSEISNSMFRSSYFSYVSDMQEPSDPGVEECGLGIQEDQGSHLNS